MGSPSITTEEQPSETMKLRVALMSLLVLPGSSGQMCGICDDGVAMSNPDRQVPLFGNETTSMTCQEKDSELSQVTSEDCLNAKIDWEVDLASFCGCEGAEPDTNNPDGCSLCMEGETFTSAPDDISSGYPLTNLPLSCQYVYDVAPHVKYINMCREFQDWYGTDVCCIRGADPAPAPTTPPTTSAAVSIQTSLMIVALMAGCVTVL